MMNFHCVYMFSQLLEGLRGHCSWMSMKESSSFFSQFPLRAYGNLVCCCHSNIVTVFLMLCVLWAQFLDEGDFMGVALIFHKCLFLVFLQEAMDLEAGQPHTQNVLRRTNHLWTLQMNKLWFRRSSRSWCWRSSTLSPPTRQQWKTQERQVCITESFLD